jgi:hypothetical protein
MLSSQYFLLNAQKWHQTRKIQQITASIDSKDKQPLKRHPRWPLPCITAQNHTESIPENNLYMHNRYSNHKQIQKRRIPILSSWNICLGQHTTINTFPRRNTLHQTPWPPLSVRYVCGFRHHHIPPNIPHPKRICTLSTKTNLFKIYKLNPAPTVQSVVANATATHKESPLLWMTMQCALTQENLIYGLETLSSHNSLVGIWVNSAESLNCPIRCTDNKPITKESLILPISRHKQR